MQLLRIVFNTIYGIKKNNEAQAGFFPFTACATGVSTLYFPECLTDTLRVFLWQAPHNTGGSRNSSAVVSKTTSGGANPSPPATTDTHRNESVRDDIATLAGVGQLPMVFNESNQD